MENRSRNCHRAALYAASIERRRKLLAQDHCLSERGGLTTGPPIAVIDIGSNSIRLVVYEGLTRSPTPIFNEKVLAGLGRQVQSTGLLPVGCHRYRVRCVTTLSCAMRHFAVTAYLGDCHRRLPGRAEGRAFIAEAERICRTKIYDPFRKT